MHPDRDKIISAPQSQEPDPLTITPSESNSQLAHDSLLRVIGFILAIIAPPIGLIISIIVLRNRKKRLQKTSPLSRAGVIIGGILSVPVMLYVGFFALVGGFYGNGPQSAFKPIGSRLEQYGMTKICDKGDNGHGLDNTVPWYHAYYSAPATDKLTSEVYAASANANFKLSPNSNKINELKNFAKTSQTIPQNTDDYFNPNADYLMGSNGSRILTVTINRETSVTLDCDQGVYGRQQATGTDTAILDMYME